MIYVCVVVVCVCVVGAGEQSVTHKFYEKVDLYNISGERVSRRRWRRQSCWRRHGFILGGEITV